MVKHTIRKVKGSRKPWGKKDKMGWALYYNGKRVRPHFANWFPTKARALSYAKGIDEDNKGH